MKRLIDDGIEITAIHNHLLRTSPAVFYMHVGGQGDPVKLAQTLHAALAWSQTPLAPPAPAAAPARRCCNVAPFFAFAAASRQAANAAMLGASSAAADSRSRQALGLADSINTPPARQRSAWDRGTNPQPSSISGGHALAAVPYLVLFVVYQICGAPFTPPFSIAALSSGRAANALAFSGL